MTSVQIAFQLITGILSDFFGYKLQKLVIALTWFVFGFLLAGIIIGLCHAKLDDNVILLIQVVAGFALGLISMPLEKISVFIILLLGGFSIVYTYTPHAWYFYLLAGVAGLALAILSIKFFDEILIVLSALFGGNQIGSALKTIFKFNQPITIAIIVALVILGCVVQYALFYKNRPKKA